MASVNKVIIVGNLGKEPELRYTPAGAPVANFPVATTERWKDKGGNTQEATEWHSLVVWGKNAENCNQYLRKGSGVYVEGRIKTRSWDDRDGNKRYKTEIVVQHVQFLGGARQGDGQGDGQGDQGAGGGSFPANSGGGYSGPNGGGGNGSGYDGGNPDYPNEDDLPF